MRIQNNISAINAYNNLKKTNRKERKVSERLSSGYRINQAADDAAGLSISQRMRAQISGLDQAARNVQDGMSMIQTAEGGLKEVNSLLQRMRELTVKAANDTLTPEDRQAIQLEINELRNEIDNIADNTEFGDSDIKLLRPPIVEEESETQTGKTDIVFIVDRTASMGPYIDDVKNNLGNFVSSLDDIDARHALLTYGNEKGDENQEQKIEKEKFDGSGFTSDTKFLEDKLEAIDDSGGSPTREESGLEAIMNGALDKEGGVEYEYRTDASKQFIMVTDAGLLVSDEPTSGYSSDEYYGEYTIEQVSKELVNKDIKLNIAGPKEDSDDITDAEKAYEQLSQLSEPTEGSYVDVEDDNFSDELEVLGEKIADDAGVIEKDEMPELKLQIGPNSEDEFCIELFDARSERLNIGNIMVEPPEKAQEFLKDIDQAISEVSSARSKFGSSSNRLEHIFDNVRNTEENLQAAESQIRDADIAEESSDLTKNQIISQAGILMLAQANNLPQGILQLLP